MAHELEIRADGKANFAYNAAGGRPWHGLGIPLADKNLTAEQMLEQVNGDYEVWLTPTYVKDERTGEFIEINERFATVRHNPETQTLQPFEIFKNRYRTEQNRDIVDKALAIVGASHGDAVIETMGVMFDGAQFFVTIDLGKLFIDPLGINDRIDRFLMAKTSHDGSSPVVLANTDIRVVCNNTATFAEQNARRVFRVRHTPNKEERIAQATSVLGFSLQWGQEFERAAMELLRVPMPQNSRHIDRVLDGLWPEKNADTDRKRDNRNAIVNDIRARYPSPTNAGAVGFNGWGFWNAITEHLDHGRGKAPEKMALASLSEEGHVPRRKMQAQSLILATV